VRALLNLGLAVVFGFVLYRAGVADLPFESVLYGGSSGPCEQAVCRTQWFFDEVTGLPVGVVLIKAKDPPFRAPRVYVSELLPPDAEMSAQWTGRVWFGVLGGVLMLVSVVVVGALAGASAASCTP
jgi:hypothetical protein